MFFQPPTWAQKLFKEENLDVKTTTKPSQPTHANEAAEVKYSKTQRIPTSGSPNFNSKASSMEQHNMIPGLFIAKKDEARSRKPKTSTKRKQETVIDKDTSPNPTLKPQQVTGFLIDRIGPPRGILMLMKAGIWFFGLIKLSPCKITL